MADFVYNLPRLLALHEAERELAAWSGPALAPLTPLTPLPPPTPRAIGVLSGSFNPLTRGHAALVEAAWREGIDGILLLLPLRAVDKEAVTRASAVDRALVLTEWARRHAGTGVALVNRGLYVEQAALLAERYPSSRIVFIVGHDKIVQIFDPRYYEEREAALRALFARATFRVAPRAGRGDAALQTLLAQDGNAPFAPGVAALALDADADADVDVDALSSTAVREKVGAGEPWELLVPHEAARFIREARPYAPPQYVPDGEELDPYGLRLSILAGAATGRLAIATAADFAALYRAARAETAEGYRWRAFLREQQSPIA